MVLVTGEVTTTAVVNTEQVVRDAIKSAGYDDPATGLDYKTCNIIVALEEPSPDLQQAVGAARSETASGYACSETDQYLPQVQVYATALTDKLNALRKDGTLAWLRPDGQVSVTLQDGKVYAVVMNVQHAEDVTVDQMTQDLTQHVLSEIPTTSETQLLLQTSGRFVLGGPHASAGKTTGTHGRDARQTLYHRVASHMAQSLVAAKQCTSCTVSITTAVGLPLPVCVHVDCEGGDAAACRAWLDQQYDWKPAALMELDTSVPKPQSQAV